MNKKVYKTLGKMCRQQLREKQTDLTRARAQDHHIRQTMHEMQRNLEHEHSFTKQYPHFQYLFETFKKDLIHKQLQLNQERRLLDLQLQEFQKHLKMLFSEMKAYEIPYERFQKEKIRQDEARDQKNLDEISQSTFRNKSQKGSFPLSV